MYICTYLYPPIPTKGSVRDRCDRAFVSAGWTPPQSADGTRLLLPAVVSCPVCVCVCVCAYMSVRMRALFQYLSISVCIQMNTDTHTHTYMYVGIYVHMYIYALMYI